MEWLGYEGLSIRGRPKTHHRLVEEQSICKNSYLDSKGIRIHFPIDSISFALKLAYAVSVPRSKRCEYFFGTVTAVTVCSSSIAADVVHSLVVFERRFKALDLIRLFIDKKVRIKSVGRRDPKAASFLFAFNRSPR